MSRFNKKHLEALKLLKENKLTAKEVAEKVGLSADHLYDLMAGDSKAGQVGKEFHAELTKINKYITQQTDQLVLQIRNELYDKLARWVKSIKRVNQVSSKTDHKKLMDAINALNKAYPQVNVTQYTYKVGLTPEEMVNEYKRIAGVLKDTKFDSRGISSLIASRPTKRALSDQGDDGLHEEAQGLDVPSEPEAGEIPQSDGTGTGDIRGE
jgi:hypothetical protein